MSDDKGKLILFQSTHYVMSAEKLLLDAGYRPQVVPVPRSISSDCGVALLIDSRHFDDASALLAGAGIVIAGSVDASDAKGV